MATASLSQSDVNDDQSSFGTAFAESESGGSDINQFNHQDPEAELLDSNNSDSVNKATFHSLKTAPIITGDAYGLAKAETYPQRALYGQILAQHAPGFPETVDNPKLYVNTNAPFSALVCGVQGSGKSHTTSVLLESCLIKDDRLGSLPAPLGGLVFHFDTAAGGGAVQPCEAAYVGSLDSIRGKSALPPNVTILVMPTSLTSMRRVYAGLSNVRVEPLHFAPDDISASRLLAMMKVDVNDQMPLYMESIMNILRSTDEDVFSYAQFRTEMNAQQYNPSQKMMLNIRLGLLDTCLAGGNNTNRVTNSFSEGSLTIIDLSSPFMDPSSACGFFDLILGLFVETRRISTGKLVVLDEAHKYLNDNGSSSRLTESLLAIIRQQRHLNMRVLISTQEPTVVPSKFLDLCSMVIAHRFASPSWLTHLTQHISTSSENSQELFRMISTLRAGQAVMFAPAGVSVSIRGSKFRLIKDGTSLASISPLGSGYLLVKSRLRVTQDGGHSLLAVADSDFATRIRPSSARTTTVTSIPQSTTIAQTRSPSAPSTDLPRGVSLSTADPQQRLVAPASLLVTSASAPIFTDLVPPKFGPLIITLKGLVPKGKKNWTRNRLQKALKKVDPLPFLGDVSGYVDEAVQAGILTFKEDGLRPVLAKRLLHSGPDVTGQLHDSPGYWKNSVSARYSMIPSMGQPKAVVSGSQSSPSSSNIPKINLAPAQIQLEASAGQKLAPKPTTSAPAAISPTHTLSKHATAVIHPRFIPLVTLLRGPAPTGNTSWTITKLKSVLRKMDSPLFSPGQVGRYVEEAHEAGILAWSGKRPILII